MWIEIKKLKVQTLIGVHEAERVTTRELVLNLFLKIDASIASQSDHVKDTVDYEKIHSLILEFSKKNKSHLLEHFAYHLVEDLFIDEKILEIKIEIEKADILSQCESVVLRYHRVKKESK